MGGFSDQNNITKLLYQRMQCTYNLNYIIYYADN